MYYEILEHDKRPISQREKEIILLIASGDTNYRIAQRLKIGVTTVQFHVRSINNKLRSRCRASIPVYAIVHGIISVEEVVPLIKH